MLLYTRPRTSLLTSHPRYIIVIESPSSDSPPFLSHRLRSPLHNISIQPQLQINHHRSEPYIYTKGAIGAATALFPGLYLHIQYLPSYLGSRRVMLVRAPNGSSSSQLPFQSFLFPSPSTLPTNLLFIEKEIAHHTHHPPCPIINYFYPL
jgi:hypothetical protein